MARTRAMRDIYMWTDEERERLVRLREQNPHLSWRRLHQVSRTLPLSVLLISVNHVPERSFPLTLA